MKNIKNITISIFAIIGFVFILSSFTNQSQETHGTPESHVWEFSQVPGVFNLLAINKKTGEVRKFDTQGIAFKKDGSIEDYATDKYIVMKPVE